MAIFLCSRATCKCNIFEYSKRPKLTCSCLAIAGAVAIFCHARGTPAEMWISGIRAVS